MTLGSCRAKEDRAGAGPWAPNYVSETFPDSADWAPAVLKTTSTSIYMKTMTSTSESANSFIHS